MLDSDDLRQRVHSLKSERQFNYTLAHWTVHTDLLTPAEAAAEVVRGLDTVTARRTGASDSPDPDLAAEVRTSSGSYPLWVGWDIIEELAERVRSVLDTRVAYVISDTGAQPQARRVQVSMERAGIPTHLFFIPSGEQSKTLETAQRIYSLLGRTQGRTRTSDTGSGRRCGRRPRRIRRRNLLRGIPYAQVPTTLLAMMDASIGGKTAVDLPQGKNLVGAFYQPKFVLADVSTLRTLPERELNSGWAEALKHGLIMDEGLLSTFESRRESIRSLEPEIATDVMRRSMAIKAAVVSKDEKETLGIRVLLNYGHTIGHGLEAATGYSQYLHGEAVSVGMMGAARIGCDVGLMSAADVERQKSVLADYGLPLHAKGVDPDRVLDAMRSDKKTAAGAIGGCFWTASGRLPRKTTFRRKP